jgi:NAD(P)-dependent dehydrogenase (short-subunit alcohol dehydrogenase family)
MSKKILVTGATGTIGKAVVTALKNENASFVAGVRDKAAASEKLEQALNSSASISKIHLLTKQQQKG